MAKAGPPATAEERLDALCRDLVSHGLEVEDYREKSLPGEPIVGRFVRLRSCEVAFRIDDPGLLLLIHYRRHASARSLRHPFADLLAFLLVATREEFGVERVMGQIQTEPHPDGRGLDDARLTRCYQRFFGTDTMEYDYGEWLYSEIEPLRRRLTDVGHLASPLQESPARSLSEPAFGSEPSGDEPSFHYLSSG